MFSGKMHLCLNVGCGERIGCTRVALCSAICVSLCVYLCDCRVMSMGERNAYKFVVSGTCCGLNNSSKVSQTTVWEWGLNLPG